MKQPLLIVCEGRIPRPFRAGLLIFLLTCLPAPGILFSQADGGNAGGENPESAASLSPEEEIPPAEEPPPLELRLETSSASATVNRPWAVYVLVNHPRPSEVNVKPPRFPPALVLERVRTETRLIRREVNPEESAAGEAASEPPPQNERWTRVEFLFTPRSTGSVTIDPFEASALGRIAETGTVTLRIREEPRTVKRYEPRFRWVNASPVPLGEPGELLLELSDWDPQKEVPLGIFRGRTPVNAILEESLPVLTGEGIYRYTVSVIPLEESDITIAAYSFEAGTFTLAVPEIKVGVLPAGPVHESVSPRIQEENSPEEAPPERNFFRPFPAYREKVFPLFQRRYVRIVTAVRSLWESGRRADALAEIRRNERDSFPGPFLVPLRGAMEQALGLDFTEDESWRPLKLPFALWVILGFLVLSSVIFLLVFRPRVRRAVFPEAGTPDGSPEKTVTSRRLSGFRAVILVVLLIGVAFIFLDEGLGNFLMGDFLIERLGSPGKAAVLEETPAYRVPDLKGAVNARFDEGQPVTLGDYRGDWRYAESPDGRSGWVPREAVVTY